MRKGSVRLLSVVFAVLLVTSSVAVATAGGDWSTNATDTTPRAGAASASSVSNAATASMATTAQVPLRTVFTDDFDDNDISDWNTSGRPESPGYTVDSQTATTEPSIRSSGTKGNGNGKGNGNIQNGSSTSDDLETQSTDTGDVIADNGRMRLRVHQCYFVQSRQHLGTFEGNLTVSFDWETASDQWQEKVGWRLVNATSGESIPYEVVSGTDVQSPGYSGNKQGSVTVHTQVDGPVAVEFYVTPSTYCGNGDHANTYIWVDNVAVDYRPVVPTAEAMADNFSDGDTAEWNESGASRRRATRSIVSYRQRTAANRRRVPVTTVRGTRGKRKATAELRPTIPVRPATSRRRRAAVTYSSTLAGCACAPTSAISCSRGDLSASSTATLR
jgi:hypothetical protein